VTVNVRRFDVSHVAATVGVRKSLRAVNDRATERALVVAPEGRADAHKLALLKEGGRIGFFSTRKGLHWWV
jgi:hypothetical protein